MTNSRNEKRPVGLVTGAGGFLGRAISLKLAEEGYDLILHARHMSDEIKELVHESWKLGADVKVVQADLSKTDRISFSFLPALKFFRRLDLLVNSASLFYPTPFQNPVSKEWEKLFSVNLFAPYFLSRTTVPWLRKAKGCIVNMTDIYGMNPTLPDYMAYCASKAGLLNLTKALALELGPNIRVNAVSPGAITLPKAYGRKRRMELIRRSVLKRQGTPEEIAQAVYFMATNKFLTGQVLAVDGGRFI